MSNRKIKFNVGKTNTGFDAYAEEAGGVIATTGKTFSELKTNLVDAYNAHAEYHKLKPVTADDVVMEFDIPSFFESYGIINAKALSHRIGMNNTLLSHYIKGVKKPSHKQVEKILTGLKEVGRELTELELA